MPLALKHLGQLGRSLLQSGRGLSVPKVNTVTVKEPTQSCMFSLALHLSVSPGPQGNMPHISLCCN